MLLMSFYSYGFADPGEVDEDGGHYNQKTGEYHYHIKKELSDEAPQILLLSNRKPLWMHNGMLYRWITISG